MDRNVMDKEKKVKEMAAEYHKQKKCLFNVVGELREKKSGVKVLVKEKV